MSVFVGFEILNIEHLIKFFLGWKIPLTLLTKDTKDQVEKGISIIKLQKKLYSQQKIRIMHLV